MVKYQQCICSFSKDTSTQLEKNKMKQPFGIKSKLLYIYWKGEEAPINLAEVKTCKIQLCRDN